MLKKLINFFTSLILFFIFFSAQPSISDSDTYTLKDLDVYGYLYKDKAGGSLKRIESIYRHYFNKYSKEDNEFSFEELKHFEKEQEEASADKIPKFDRSKYSKSVLEYTDKKVNELRRNNFSKKDLNKNKTLSFEEYYGESLNELKSLDIDGDNSLTLEEVKNAPSRKKVFKSLSKANSSMKKFEKTLDKTLTGLEETSKSLKKFSSDYKKNTEKINEGIRKVESLAQENEKTLKISN